MSSVNQAVMQLSKAIVESIEGDATMRAKTQTLVTEAIEHKRSALVQAAVMIEAAHPEDRAIRNNRLSILRVQIRRASVALELDKVLSVKKVKERWTVTEAEPVDPAAIADRKLSNALDLVVKNIRKAAVRRTLLEALQVGQTGRATGTRRSPRTPRASNAPTVVAH